LKRLEKCQLRLKVIDTEKCFIRKAGMKYHVDLTHCKWQYQLEKDMIYLISYKIDPLKELPELGHVLIHGKINTSNFLEMIKESPIFKMELGLYCIQNIFFILVHPKFQSKTTLRL
jgi:hypothetical protein